MYQMKEFYVGYSGGEYISAETEEDALDKFECEYYTENYEVDFIQCYDEDGKILYEKEI